MATGISLLFDEEDWVFRRKPRITSILGNARVSTFALEVLSPGQAAARVSTFALEVLRDPYSARSFSTPLGAPSAKARIFDEDDWVYGKKPLFHPPFVINPNIPFLRYSIVNQILSYADDENWRTSNFNKKPGYTIIIKRPILFTVA